MASAADVDMQTSLLKQMDISDLSEYEDLNLFPQFNVLDPVRFAITNEVHRITGVDKQVICRAVAWTSSLEHGDLLLPTPALRCKDKKPDVIAAEIADQLSCKGLQKPKADGTFVRFFCDPQSLATSVLPTILKLGPKYGFNPLLGRANLKDPASRQQRIVIEYSSPNIAKEFHAGHLRSTIIGGFLSKLYQRSGWEVIQMNYLGDWGKQYGVLNQGFERFGSEEALSADPIKHLNDVYVRINQESSAEQATANALTKKQAALQFLKLPPKAKKGAAPVEHTWTDEQEQELQQLTADLAAEKKRLEDLPSIDEKARRFFKRMTEGDPDAIRNWQRFRDLSISRYQGMYERLNIKFDDYSGESTVKEEDMAKCAKIMEENGISEESQGAVKVDFNKHGAKKLGVTLVRKRDGTALYLTRDIAANYERYEKYKFDKMLYVVASQQDTHMAQFFKILELLGPPYSDVVKKCQHVTFGMVKAASGETMSTRKGTVVSLDDALNDIGEHMHEVMKKNPAKFDKVAEPGRIADLLGISSIIVYDFTGKVVNGYNFDKDKMTSVEGDTGPYLQYTHARICSIRREALAKFGHEQVGDEALAKADLSLAASTTEGANLIRLLSQWADVVNNTLKTHEPVTVLVYLMKLTHRFSSTYEAKHPVTGARSMSVMYAESEEKRVAVMALYECARHVLRNGMEVLGLTPVEAM